MAKSFSILSDTTTLAFGLEKQSDFSPIMVIV
jgi:hypothetical protein